MIGGLKNCFQQRLIFYFRLQFTINFFEDLVPLVDTGKAILIVFCFIESKLTSDNSLCTHAVFFYFFLRVCSKQSYCFAFKTTPEGGTRYIVYQLKGFSRLVIGFDVHKNHIESLYTRSVFNFLAKKVTNCAG